jgi:hypothetical protein
MSGDSEEPLLRLNSIVRFAVGPTPCSAAVQTHIVRGLEHVEDPEFWKIADYTG